MDRPRQLSLFTPPGACLKNFPLTRHIRFVIVFLVYKHPGKYDVREEWKKKKKDVLVWTIVTVINK